MRLWTISPHYLDAKGIVALWRETLLAQAVLHGKTKGYKNHPQLNRFRDNKDLLNNYLHLICDEADARGYKFDRSKIIAVRSKGKRKLPVTSGQVSYEYEHLLKKLKIRDPARHKEFKDLKKTPAVFDLFKITAGENIEPWEVL